jgi:hypothetical protein
METVTIVFSEPKQSKKGTTYYSVKDSTGRVGSAFAQLPLNVPITNLTVTKNEGYDNYTFSLPKNTAPATSQAASVPVNAPAYAPPSAHNLAINNGVTNKQIALLSAAQFAGGIDSTALTSSQVLTLADSFLKWLE